jgi:hypothetical protein
MSTHASLCIEWDTVYAKRVADTVMMKIDEFEGEERGNKFMLGILGIFVPVMKEFIEMYYQYDRDYIFNSEKFENTFQFKPTSYEAGIREIIRQDYS